MNWAMVLGTFGLILVAACGFVGFQALDRWHAKRAWRRATEDAQRYMRENHGVEVDDNGKVIRHLPVNHRPK